MPSVEWRDELKRSPYEIICDHIAWTNRPVITTVLEGRVEVDVTAAGRTIFLQPAWPVLISLAPSVPLSTEGHELEMPRMKNNHQQVHSCKLRTRVLAVSIRVRHSACRILHDHSLPTVVVLDNVFK